MIKIHNTINKVITKIYLHYTMLVNLQTDEKRKWLMDKG